MICSLIYRLARGGMAGSIRGHTLAPKLGLKFYVLPVSRVVHMLHPYARTSWYITSIAHVVRLQRDGSSKFRPKAFHQLKWTTQSICMPSTTKSKDVAGLTKHGVLACFSYCDSYTENDCGSVVIPGVDTFAGSWTSISTTYSKEVISSHRSPLHVRCWSMRYW